MAVGSLQKPFVAKAWAAAHPAEASPSIPCTPSDHCWLRQGHGTLGLPSALARSCNTYFLRLAEATPKAVLARVFEAEGFRHQGLTPSEAIGLPGPKGLVTIAPSRLLQAYVRLLKEPWPLGEATRGEVRRGLREAAQGGTASLGQWGFWAKTGTVPTPSDPLRTSGLALAVDDSGWAILGRLPLGTGRETARALDEPLSRWRPGHPPLAPRPTASGPKPPFRAATVAVRLLDLLGARTLQVRNAGTTPIPTREGYLGPGAQSPLRPGFWVGPGLLEVQAQGLSGGKRFYGELACIGAPGRPLALKATLALREYAEGVVAAELPYAKAERRIPLGAAILRFLAENRRHPDADVCDSTHCAWFIGRGPRIGQPSAPETQSFSDAEWAEVLAQSQQPGPSQWSSHCGGTPLAPHALWGFGDQATLPCPRHEGRQDTRPWQRTWSLAEVRKAFGSGVERLKIGMDRGVWVLEVGSRTGLQTFRYDDAHRRLAARLGWGALPSPADHIERVAEGFRASGVGLGHRVGLCLGD